MPDMSNANIALLTEAQNALTELRRVRDLLAARGEFTEPSMINRRIVALKKAIEDAENEYEPADPMRGVEFPFAENN